MSAVCITCDSCGRNWTLGFEDSAPFAAEVASRPCPYCEAYTLGCHEPPGGRSGAVAEPVGQVADPPSSLAARRPARRSDTAR